MSLDATTIVGALVIGGILAVLLDNLRRYQTRSHAASAAETARRIVEEARKDADNLRAEARTQAKDAGIQARVEFERTAKEQRRQLEAVEGALRAREEQFAQTVKAADGREGELQRRDETIRTRETQLAEREAECGRLLEARKPSAP